MSSCVRAALLRGQSLLLAGLVVLQGCGKGQGGSEVEVSVGQQILGFTVEDTGHFQNFKAREIGKLTLDRPGRYTLTVKPKKRAAAAVMDLRSITLKPLDK